MAQEPNGKILTKDEIQDAGIVSGGVDASRRATTYDATIGDILLEGIPFEGETFKLEPRGVVWVVSAEEFAFPATKTGLATLKTTLTHKGLLALNVGVIDPLYTGPLGTALVNLSKGCIPLKKGDQFFRVLVFDHREAPCTPSGSDRATYVAETQIRSRLFARTFLDMDSLVDDVAAKVFKFPKLGVVIGWAGLGVALGSILLAILAILATMMYEVWADHRHHPGNEPQVEAPAKEPRPIVATPNQNPTQNTVDHIIPTVPSNGASPHG